VCQAIPRPVLSVSGDRAEVLYDGVPTWVTVHGIPDLAAGEYVVVYAGNALERMAAADAEEMLTFLSGLDQMLAEAVE
jgi:hydrogenase assembly chaperone HypC/HupF